MKGFTDIHHHILYGIDDGPDSFERMARMLHKSSEDGVARIIATPHVTPGVRRFNLERYEQRLVEAQRYCAENGLPLEIYGGAEILYTPMTVTMLLDGRIPTMADTQYVLVEFLPDIEFRELFRAVRKLVYAGYRPILAHIERYSCLMHRLKRVYALKDDYEVCLQVNCNTILNPKGFWVRRGIRRLLDDEMVDFVATDAHNIRSRKTHMREAYRLLRRAYGREYATYLTGRGEELDLNG